MKEDFMMEMLWRKVCEVAMGELGTRQSVTKASSQTFIMLPRYLLRSFDSIDLAIPEA
jgi:hypothetical protein